MEKTKESPSTRELALKWWKELFGTGNQLALCEKYYPHYLIDSDIFSSPSSDEIEYIWEKENKPVHQQIIDAVGGEKKFCELVNIKPNQKQYK